jgi:hypothetical protein
MIELFAFGAGLALAGLSIAMVLAIPGGERCRISRLKREVRVLI